MKPIILQVRILCLTTPLFFVSQRMGAGSAHDYHSLNFSPSRRRAIPLPAPYKLTNASTEMVRTWYGLGTALVRSKPLAGMPLSYCILSRLPPVPDNTDGNGTKFFELTNYAKLKHAVMLSPTALKLCWACPTERSHPPKIK